MKSLGSTKSKINKDKNGDFLPHLEFTEVVLVHCNTVNNNYQQDSRVLYTFAISIIWTNLDISPKTFIFLKTFDSKFSYTELWFPDQNSKSLVIN